METTTQDSNTASELSIKTTYGFSKKTTTALGTAYRDINLASRNGVMSSSTTAASSKTLNSSLRRKYITWQCIKQSVNLHVLQVIERVNRMAE